MMRFCRSERDPLEAGGTADTTITQRKKAGQARKKSSLAEEETLLFAGKE
jgi:hypothetical protein